MILKEKKNYQKEENKCKEKIEIKIPYVPLSDLNQQQVENDSTHIFESHENNSYAVVKQQKSDDTIKSILLCQKNLYANFSNLLTKQSQIQPSFIVNKTNDKQKQSKNQQNIVPMETIQTQSVDVGNEMVSDWDRQKNNQLDAQNNLMSQRMTINKLDQNQDDSSRDLTEIRSINLPTNGCSNFSKQEGTGNRNHNLPKVPKKQQSPTKYRLSENTQENIKRLSFYKKAPQNNDLSYLDSLNRSNIYSEKKSNVPLKVFDINIKETIPKKEEKSAIEKFKEQKKKISEKKSISSSHNTISLIQNINVPNSRQMSKSFRQQKSGLIDTNSDSATTPVLNQGNSSKQFMNSTNYDNKSFDSFLIKENYVYNLDNTNSIAMMTKSGNYSNSNGLQCLQMPSIEAWNSFKRARGRKLQLQNLVNNFAREYSLNPSSGEQKSLSQMGQPLQVTSICNNNLQYSKGNYYDQSNTLYLSFSSRDRTIHSSLFGKRDRDKYDESNCYMASQELSSQFTMGNCQTNEDLIGSGQKRQNQNFSNVCDESQHYDSPERFEKIQNYYDYKYGNLEYNSISQEESQNAIVKDKNYVHRARKNQHNFSMYLEKDRGNQNCVDFSIINPKEIQIQPWNNFTQEDAQIN